MNTIRSNIDQEPADKQSGLPSAWRDDFPVGRSAEHQVTRRQFARMACCSCVALGAGMVAKARLLSEPASTAPKFVALVDQLPIGGYKLFRYPTDDHPCILVRLAENAFAAYSQSCTHLMCPVNYRHETREFCCPCHNGFFSAEDGRVLAGPPLRPLPRYPVEIRGAEVWIGRDADDSKRNR